VIDHDVASYSNLGQEVTKPEKATFNEYYTRQTSIWIKYNAISFV